MLTHTNTAELESLINNLHGLMMNLLSVDVNHFALDVKLQIRYFLQKVTVVLYARSPYMQVYTVLCA